MSEFVFSSPVSLLLHWQGGFYLNLDPTLSLPNVYLAVLPLPSPPYGRLRDTATIIVGELKANEENHDLLLGL